jgi:RNA polymerase sigma-70 factor (ECF subfamily)
MNVQSVYHKTQQQLDDELSCIRRAKKNPEHFGPLYKENYERIFRYVFQRVMDEDTAADLTAQIFIKALNNLHKYEFKGVPFSSWLFRIAKSEVYQSFRDKKNERIVNIESYQIVDVAEELDEDVTNQNKSVLLESISELKENDVTLIEMRFFEKRSFREIGEILELTENNAKVKTFRALEKLKLIFNSKKEKKES